jgi:dTDP-4-dehydrorhamnose reductase
MAYFAGIAGMKILVTGASGLVGATLARIASRQGHEVIGIVGSYPGKIDGLAAQHALDLTDLATAQGIALRLAPDAIANCAAVSVPEMCEAHPELAHALNVALPTALAESARLMGCRLIHLSSEQVFNGQQTAPYSHAAAVSPINLYGRQKVASEQAVHRIARDLAITLRAPLLMGDSLGGQRSVHERLLLDWAAGGKLRLFNDEFRQPCTAANLATAMLELCARDNFAGVFHWAGAEVISRHDLGIRIREHFNLTEMQAPIGATKHADVPGIVGKRQPCLALALEPLANELRTRPQTIAEQLAELTVPAACRVWYASAVAMK